MSVRRWIVLALGMLALLAAASVFLLSGPAVNRSARPSTYSSNPAGCKALFLVMEELQLPVKRFGRGFQWLREREGILVAIDPRGVGYSAREIKKVKEWIKKGNRLIIFQGREKRPTRHKEKQTKKEREFIRFIRGGSLALRFGLRLKPVERVSRSSVRLELPDADWHGNVDVSNRARWKKPSKDWDIVAQDAEGPILVTRKMGKGEVTAMCDSTLLSNRHLKKDQNLRFALALLLKNGSPKEILFDEHHHGYMVSGSLREYIGSSVFSWIFIQAALGVIILFYSRKAMHAGRFRSLSRAPGRSSLEYVDSMANVLETCGAGSAALEVILKRFLSELSQRKGIPLRTLGMDTLGNDGLSVPGAPGDLADLIVECRKAVERDEDPEKAVVLARRLAITLAEMGVARARGVKA